MNDMPEIANFKRELKTHLISNGALCADAQIDIKQFISTYQIQEMKLMMAMHDLFKVQNQPLIFEDKDIFQLGTGRTLNSFPRINAYLRMGENERLAYILSLINKKMITNIKYKIPVSSEVLKVLIREYLKVNDAKSTITQIDLKPFLTVFNISVEHLKDALRELSFAKDPVMFENPDFLKLGLPFDNNPPTELKDLPAVKAYLQDNNMQVLVKEMRDKLGQKKPDFTTTFEDRRIAKKFEQPILKSVSVSKPKRKQFYKRWYFWLILFILVALSIIRFGNIDLDIDGTKYIPTTSAIFAASVALILSIFRNQLAALGDKLSKKGEN